MYMYCIQFYHLCSRIMKVKYESFYWKCCLLINTSIDRVLTIYLCVFLIQAVFQQFDLDGSGTVDTYELDKLFSTLGERERERFAKW